MNMVASGCRVFRQRDSEVLDSVNVLCDRVSLVFDEMRTRRAFTGTLDPITR